MSEMNRLSGQHMPESDRNPGKSAERKEPPAENKMGIMPVGKLLFSMSVPMMISMMVQALYNIVDSIFVSMISENALTAVSLAFPLQTLMISFGVGLGVGINAYLSRALGQRDFNLVDKAAANGIFLELSVMAVFMLVGLLAAGPYFRVQTDNTEIVSFGHTYLSIVCCCSLGFFMEITFERLMQSTGKTFYAMVTQLCGAIFNIIMDPILIFGLFGLPKLGIAGAAIATVMGQHIAAALAVYLNLKKNKEITFRVRGFKPDGGVIRGIFSVGLPSVIMQAIGSVMTYGMNQILIAFTPTATAVFGVYFKLNSIIFMPVFGLSNGSVPIIAFNYGAGRRERVEKTIRLVIISAIGIMTLGCLAFQFFPDKLLRLFNASDNMLSIGVPAFRIIGLSFPVAGFCIAVGSVFQALGRGIYSMINSILRQLVVLLPSAWLLSRTGVLGNVWWSFVIAEVMSFTCSFLFFMKIRREVIANI